MSQYSPLAPYYDALTSDIDYKALASYYEEIFRARSKCASSIADLGCGTGSLGIELCRRGYEMICVDASEDMLMSFREKLTDAYLSSASAPLMLCQRMEELDLYGTVSAAICSLDGMNYIPGSGIKEVLRRLNLFIEPGGLFIFDILSPEELISRDGMISVDEDEDMLCMWRTEYNEDESSVTHGLDLFLRRGELWQREEEEHKEYIHRPEELVRLLEASGFCEIELSHTGPIPGEGRIYIIAENTGGQIC